MKTKEEKLEARMNDRVYYTWERWRLTEWAALGESWEMELQPGHLQKRSEFFYLQLAACFPFSGREKPQKQAKSVWQSVNGGFACAPFGIRLLLHRPICGRNKISLFFLAINFVL
jgi:hypothetical protein